MVRGTTPTWRDSWLEWKLLVWALSTCTSLRAWRKARYMAGMVAMAAMADDLPLIFGGWWLDVIGTTCWRFWSNPMPHQKQMVWTKSSSCFKAPFWMVKHVQLFWANHVVLEKHMVKWSKKKPGDFWGGFFCQILEAGVHALQFLQRAQNIGKVVISQSRSQSSWLNGGGFWGIAALFGD